MNVPDDLQYTDHHEWLRLDGESAFVGLTDDLQQRLGTILSVQLPEAGTALICGHVAGTINSASATHILHSPLSGTVMAVNPLLASQPGVVNDSPYGDGWLFQLRMEAGEEIEHLRDPVTYRTRFLDPSATENS